MANYRKVLLTYLDILGFREMIRESVGNPGKVAEILHVLKVTKRKGTTGIATADDNGETKLITRTHNFSDLIIRITFIDNPNDLIARLNMELMMLAGIQCELTASYGILLRGGLSMGECYEDDEFIFGPALVHSYELEEKTAVFPRIVISQSLVDMASKEIATVWPLVIRRGEDAAFYVDYLYAGCRTTPGGFMSTGFKSASALIKAHQLLIADKLAHIKEERARQKVLWTALYHNAVIDRLKAEEGVDSQIKWAELKIEG
jgi:hypothetical protein